MGWGWGQGSRVFGALSCISCVAGEMRLCQLLWSLLYPPQGFRISKVHEAKARGARGAYKAKARRPEARARAGAGPSVFTVSNSACLSAIRLALGRILYISSALYLEWVNNRTGILQMQTQRQHSQDTAQHQQPPEKEPGRSILVEV